MSLPQSVSDIVDLIGYDAAMRLVGEWGGITLDVPEGKHGGPLTESLEELLGCTAAQQFFATYGGEHLYIPRCAQAIRDQRDLAIQAAYDDGTRVPDIVRSFGVTERWVWVVLKRAISTQGAGRKRDDSQLDMFSTTNG